MKKHISICINNNFFDKYQIVLSCSLMAIPDVEIFVKVNLVSNIAILVVEFSREGYKIRKVFA